MLILLQDKDLFLYKSLIEYEYTNKGILNI